MSGFIPPLPKPHPANNAFNPPLPVELNRRNVSSETQLFKAPLPRPRVQTPTCQNPISSAIGPPPAYSNVERKIALNLATSEDKAAQVIVMAAAKAVEEAGAAAEKSAEEAAAAAKTLAAAAKAAEQRTPPAYLVDLSAKSSPFALALQTASRQPARHVSGSGTSTNTTSSSGSAARFDTGPVPLERLQEAIHSMGLKKFRKYQGRGVAAVCRGQDTLMMIPTGGGKSLCFQILPLVLPGKVAIVVSWPPHTPAR